ncbi:MAG: cyclic nucleotide-binding domain-containing protein [Deltaproteobacteria bacterium]|nr:cyclic nucleotide-binding domain-containing protein [Deltaproteobacteria bacterium]
MSPKTIDATTGFVGPLAKKIKTLGTFLGFENHEALSGSGQAKLVQYQPEEVIIREGEFDNWVYWLVSGIVAVVKHDIEIKNFRRFGDMFGEMGIIEGESRSASIVAREETLCLKVDASIIDHLPPEKKALCWGNFLADFAHEGIARLTDTTDEFAGTKDELLKARIELAADKAALADMESRLKVAEHKVRKLETFILQEEFLQKHNLKKLYESDD